MITANTATAILICFICLFGMVLPILNVKIPQFISYRWSVVVVILALLIGAVVDFAELPHDARKTVLLGGLIISGGYVFLRTLEKILANGWLKGAKIEAQKGDAKVKLTQKEKE